MVASSGPVAPERDVRRVALVAMVGTSLLWYDYFVYALGAALVFPQVFFPQFSPLAGTLAAFAGFAVGFVVRPLGAVVFGHVGDRVGRKRALVWALVLMGAGTALMGVLPSFSQIGVLAPLGLVVLRLAQGLAAGGQTGGATLFATESAPAGRRGLYGGFVQLGVPVGLIAAQVAFLGFLGVLPEGAFVAWGWRVPFVLGAALIGVGLWVHRRLQDTPAFRRLEAVRDVEAGGEPLPIVNTVRTGLREVALVAGACVAQGGVFYLQLTFLVAYATSTVEVPRETVLAAVLMTAVAEIPFIVFFAALSDRVGRRPLLLLGAVLSGVWTFPFFWLVDTGSLVALGAALFVGGLFVTMIYGPQAAFFVELFRTRVRYSGSALGTEIGAILGGGFAPAIATGLLAIFGGSWAISAYLTILCAVTFVSVLLLPETYQREVEDAEPVGSAAAR